VQHTAETVVVELLYKTVVVELLYKTVVVELLYKTVVVELLYKKFTEMSSTRVHAPFVTFAFIIT
jgi:hypothetical protein